MASQLPVPIYASSTAEDIVDAYAAHYGIPSKLFLATLECESGLRANAVGDQGSSFGVAQIHLPAHPDITKAEALDPMWSINWAAQQFAAHDENIWTCARQIKGGEGS